MRFLLWTFLSVALLAAEPAMGQSSVSKSKLTLSPNKKYEIKDAYLPDQKESKCKQIYFRKASQHTWIPIIIPSTSINSYSPNLEVLWAPNSTKFAITDVAASLSDVYVYFINDIDHPVVVSKKILPQLIKEVGKARLNTDLRTRLYFEAKRWITPDTLALEVDLGYGKQSQEMTKNELIQFQKSGARPGLSYHWLYSWNPSEGFKKLRRMSAAE